MHPTTFHEPSTTRNVITDRLGVVASLLCGIHCVVTPVLLLVSPSFGQIWAHPASHWGMALLVIPVAAIMVRHSLRPDGRKWILGCGLLGILLVCVGAALPYLGSGKSSSHLISLPLPWLTASEPAGCADACCPSTASVEGKTMLLVPPAAIVTTLGGIILIIAHCGNLCACRGCREFSGGSIPRPLP